MYGRLLPVRFLLILANTVLIILLLLDRKASVQACLPEVYTQSEYDTKDTALIVGLSLSLACITVELFSFFTGISTFNAFASSLCPSTSYH
eukprot:m.55688 g.55688  ORF g.55688 m.55688 type:complete len:91 (-) comp48901_c0_seq2:135-407(-)